MLVKNWTLRITGQPSEYHVHVECDGTVESIPDLHESLRCLLGNLRLTEEEVEADLAAVGRSRLPRPGVDLLGRNDLRPGLQFVASPAPEPPCARRAWGGLCPNAALNSLADLGGLDSNS
ncbi:MAG: hypothetical protein L0211_16300 [Planctomycetaceae bacterium]|nr:hypothetical protein [Planctomycetaceae bacterium]